MNSINKFKPIGIHLCNQLRQSGVNCYIIHYNRWNNSLYIKLDEQTSKYWRIRISDHPGNQKSRYELRTDLLQSMKTDKQFLYTVNDLAGLLMRVKKDLTKTIVK